MIPPAIHGFPFNIATGLAVVEKTVMSARVGLALNYQASFRTVRNDASRGRTLFCSHNSIRLPTWRRSKAPGDF